MPRSGSGQGTPVSAPPPVETAYDPTEELEFLPNCAVSLSRYAKLVGYDEASLWGVVIENDRDRGCGPLWAENERIRIQYALAEAQQQIENFIGFPLCPTWVVGTIDEEPYGNFRWVDQQSYSPRMVTRYPRLIAAGIRATQILAQDAMITHGEQVGVVGPIATTAASTSEIRVYYPNSRRRITPSKITLSGGFVTIEIPRFRLVVQDLLNTPVQGILYETMANFLSEVDVERVYNDPSVNAELVRFGCNCTTNGCGECTETGCIYIRNGYIGEIVVRPATWIAEESIWKAKTTCNYRHRLARLHYYCGMQKLDLRMEMAIVKLAHAKLGGPPCTCDRLKAIWEMDNKIPPLMTRERINCPFGLSNGAWDAFVQARNFASVRASIL